MLFSDLYSFAEGLEGPVISVRQLAAQIVASHHEIGQIDFWPVELDEEATRGYVVYDYDRSTPYDEEFKILGIRYSDQMNRCWRRFVCCKELMHAFDTEEQRTNSRERFLTLTGELETKPRTDDFSPMLQSEYDAEWMALLVLCPKPTRDKLKASWDQKILTDLDVALEARIPEGVVRALMSDYYDEVKNDLTGI